MGSTLLTIAIPTYNRADFLDLCLRRIVEEVVSLSPSEQSLVTVHVSNNASTDDTRTILDRYQNSNKLNLKVVHQSANVGANRNIAHCYQSATTPYVWVMGDDDVILHGGLQQVLEQLQSRKVDVLYLNGYPYDKNYLDEPTWGTGQHGTILHPSADHFVQHTHVNLTFITALVVRSGVSLKNYVSILEETSLPQLSWVFTLVRDGAIFVTLKTRIYAGRMDNSGGYGAFEVFGRQLPSIAHTFFGAASKIFQSIENGLIVVWFPIHLMNVKYGKSRYLPENIDRELQHAFDGNWRFYIFLFPLIHLPKGFARMYLQLLRVVRRVFTGVLI